VGEVVEGHRLLAADCDAVDETVGADDACRGFVDNLEVRGFKPVTAIGRPGRKDERRLQNMNYIKTTLVLGRAQGAGSVGVGH